MPDHNIKNKKRFILFSNREKALLIFGGSNVSIVSGKYFVKGTFSEYLLRLSQNYETVLWVASITDGFSTSSSMQIENVVVLPVKHRSFRSLLFNALRIMQFLIKRPSVIVFHFPAYLPIFPFIRLCSPKFLAYLGVNFRVAAERGLINPNILWKYVFLKGFEYPIRKADVVLVRGNSLKKIAKDFNSNVVSSMPLGWFPDNHVVHDKGKLRNTDRFCVLYVGKVSLEKGVDVLFDAMKALANLWPDKCFCLEVFGNGSFIEALQELSEDLPKNLQLRLHGWVDAKPIMSQAFTQSDLLVCPSVYPEGAPRVIEEAMMFGVPVVASRVQGIKDEFDETEIFFVEPGSVISLSSAIGDVLFNPEETYVKVQRSQKRFEKWNSYKSAAEQHHSYLIG